MMKNRKIKFTRLGLHNFKSINDGEIYFPYYLSLQNKSYQCYEDSAVIGIYGQNGSGKTTLIEALKIVGDILKGHKLNKGIIDCFKNKEKPIILETSFIDLDNNIKIDYCVTIIKDSGTCQIDKETLSIKDGKKTSYFDFAYENENVTCQEFNKVLTVKHIEEYLNIVMSNKEYPFYSKLFIDRALTYLSLTKLKDSLSLIYIELIKEFATTKLIIYSISYFNEFDEVGIRFFLKQINKENDTIEYGNIFVPFNLTYLPIATYCVFKSTIEKINHVLPFIIPHYRIRIRIDATKRNDEMVNFVLTAIRNEKEIPLVYESNGIKKLISILSGLIEAFNNDGTLLAIDELDSGVFEYLLGEVLYAFNSFAKGQLIFTSHNMRPLEKLSSQNIFFTTTDKKRAFIRLPDFEPTCNLRDLYYRYIGLSENEENFLFDLVNTEDLIDAFFMEEEW